MFITRIASLGSNSSIAYLHFAWWVLVGKSADDCQMNLGEFQIEISMDFGDQKWGSFAIDENGEKFFRISKQLLERFYKTENAS